MPSDPHPDLPWLAFRYVAGELAGDEAAAFERRLDADQEAREAVAEAVELAGAVALLTPDVLTFPPGSRPRRYPVPQALGWMTAGAATCLASLVGLHALAPPAPPPRVTARPTVVAAEDAGSGAEAQVALAWSGLRRDDGPDDAELLAWLDEAAPGEAESALPTDASAPAEGDVPPWLIEAATLRATTGPDGSKTQEN
jgi:hypothetical protein